MANVCPRRRSRARPHRSPPVTTNSISRDRCSLTHGHTPLILTIRSLFASSTCTGDRKSTRLNSSHDQISYAVFCLKKKIIKLYIVSLITNGMHDDPGSVHLNADSQDPTLLRRLLDGPCEAVDPFDQLSVARPYLLS